MDSLSPEPLTVAQLTGRYQQACELKQAIHWQRIVDCFKRWVAGMKFGDLAILRVEGRQQLIRAAVRTKLQETSPAAAAALRAKSALAAAEIHNRLATNPASRGWECIGARNSGATGDKWSYWSAAWDAIVAIGALELGSRTEFDISYCLFEAFEAGAYCFFVTDRGIEVCPRPTTVKVDEQNKLHASTGAAFVWLGEIQDYYWHGVCVEQYVVESPAQITRANIEAESHPDVRKVKLERFKELAPAMEKPLTIPVTVPGLTVRWINACRLTQPVNWAKIVDCFQRFAAAWYIEQPEVVRIEGIDQLDRAAQIAGESIPAGCNRNPCRSQTWATMADGKVREANSSKIANKLRCSANVQFAQNATMRSRLGAIGTWFFGKRQVALGAQHSTSWLSRAVIGAVEFRNQEEFLKWYPLFEAFEAGAYCFYFTDRKIEVCVLPTLVSTDDQNRLHAASGPAFVWLNDIRDYYWHGVRVAPEIIDNPESLTVAAIESELDAEVRQVKIERWRQVQPDRDPSLIKSITALELKDRYLRASSLQQAVDWVRIEACLRRWAAALEIQVPSVVRIENVVELRKISRSALSITASEAATQSLARSQSHTHATWTDQLNFWASQARHARFLLTGNFPEISALHRDHLARQVENGDYQAVLAREKCAGSAASAAMAIRQMKLARAVAAAIEIWAPIVRRNPPSPPRGRFVWDVTLKCIVAIDALENTNQGARFTNWYQLFKAFEAGAFCFFITGTCLGVCAIPSVVRLDDRGRLHCESGPAFVWLEDVRLFYWHGVQVASYVVENPENITVADIEAERNAEVRRVKIHRFGMGRYLAAAGATEIHRDDYGILLRQEVAGEEPLVMVKVVNATPDPDGSFRDYFLRVPPTMKTAQEAVAWTFGKSQDEYGPAKET